MANELEDLLVTLSGYLKARELAMQLVMMLAYLMKDSYWSDYQIQMVH